jgi:DNA-binding IclR family transcriptional regulator
VTSKESAQTLQTLDRGVRVLELLAAASGPLSIARIADGLGVHRSIAYRLLRTLEHHRLVSRDDGSGYRPGVGLAVLARTVDASLQAAALPELTELSGDLGMTAFLVVPDGDDAVTLHSVEPRQSRVHVAYRPGIRHPLDRGAPGLALLAGRAAKPGERAEVTVARRSGWAWSRGEVLPGLSAVSAPIVGRDRTPVAAVAVVYLDEGAERDGLGHRVVAAAEAIARELP